MHSFFSHLGHPHVPVSGMILVAGLIAALWFTQWSAARVGMNLDTAWNTSVLAIVTVFLVSRVLLVMFNFRSFLKYPLLLLALRSLTSLGVVVSAAVVAGYVWWRRIPVLPLLDSWAASAALLWASVNVGFLLDGTREGMASNVSGRPQPVEIYTFFAAVVSLLAVWAALRRTYRGGEAAGLMLAAGGLAIFFIDFFRLPSELVPYLPLDPSQIIALAMFAVGGALLYRVVMRMLAEEEDSDAI